MDGPHSVATEQSRRQHALPEWSEIFLLDNAQPRLPRPFGLAHTPLLERNAARERDRQRAIPPVQPALQQEKAICNLIISSRAIETWDALVLNTANFLLFKVEQDAMETRKDI